MEGWTIHDLQFPLNTFHFHPSAGKCLPTRRGRNFTGIILSILLLSNLIGFPSSARCVDANKITNRSVLTWIRNPFRFLLANWNQIVGNFGESTIRFRSVLFVSKKALKLMNSFGSRHPLHSHPSQRPARPRKVIKRRRRRFIFWVMKFLTHVLFPLLSILHRRAKRENEK